jgi:hypothetical protein
MEGNPREESSRLLLCEEDLYHILDVLDEQSVYGKNSKIFQIYHARRRQKLLSVT